MLLNLIAFYNHILFTLCLEGMGRSRNVHMDIKNNLQESVVSFCHAGLRDQTQIFTVSRRYLHPHSHSDGTRNLSLPWFVHPLIFPKEKLIESQKCFTSKRLNSNILLYLFLCNYSFYYITNNPPAPLSYLPA